MVIVPIEQRSQACILPLHPGNTSGKRKRLIHLRHCVAVNLL
jgi:hypothetical protein